MQFFNSIAKIERSKSIQNFTRIYIEENFCKIKRKNVSAKKKRRFPSQTFKETFHMKKRGGESFAI